MTSYHNSLPRFLSTSTTPQLPNNAQQPTLPQKSPQMTLLHALNHIPRTSSLIIVRKRRRKSISTPIFNADDFDTVAPLWTDYLDNVPHLGLLGDDVVRPAMNVLYAFIVQSVAWGNNAQSGVVPGSTRSSSMPHSAIPSVSLSTGPLVARAQTNSLSALPQSKRSSSTDLHGTTNSSLLLRDGPLNTSSHLTTSTNTPTSAGVSHNSVSFNTTTNTQNTAPLSVANATNTKIRHNIGYLRCAISIDASRQNRRLRYVLYDLLRNGQFEYGGVRYHLAGWNVTLLADTEEVLTQMSSMEKDILSVVLSWNHDEEEQWMRKVAAKALAESGGVTDTPLSGHKRSQDDDLSSLDSSSRLQSDQPHKRHSSHILSLIASNKPDHSELTSRRRSISTETPSLLTTSPNRQQPFQIVSQVPRHASNFSAFTSTTTPTKPSARTYTSVISPLHPRLSSPSVVSHETGSSLLGSPFHKESLHLNVPPHSATSMLDMHPFGGEIRIDAIRERFEEIMMHLSVRQFARDVVVAVRGHPLRKLLLSPRSTEILEQVAKGYAINAGSQYVLPVHVAAVAPYVLAHRITLNKKKMSGSEDFNEKGGYIRATFLLVRQIVTNLPRP